MTQSKDPNPEKSPAPLNEAAMLDWVEERLSRIEQSKLAAASGRAGVAQRVAQMQANRRVLTNLPEEHAPPELMERVLAALEREALLELAGDDAPSGPIPISSVPVQQSRGLRWERRLPGLALAAGIALLAVGGVYWAMVLQGPTVQPGQFGPAVPGPIAQADPSGERSLTGPEATTTMTDAQAPTAVAAGRENENLVGENGVSAYLAAAMSSAQRSRPVDAGEAMALAREGRLVMRVLARNTRNIGQVEELAAAKTTRPWRLTPGVPGAVLAAVLPVEPLVGPLAEGQVDRPLLASREPGKALSLMSGLIGPGAAASPLPVAFRAEDRVKATYIADVADSDRSLDNLRRTFAERLRATVVFEALDEAAVLPATTDPDAVLWWTQGPQTWTGRVAVPVVVEQR